MAIPTLTKAGVALSGLLQSVANVIDAWEVEEQKTEKAYQTRLAKTLVEAAPGARIEKEYRVEGTAA